MMQAGRPVTGRWSVRRGRPSRGNLGEPALTGTVACRDPGGSVARSRGSRMTKHTILFLAANPVGTSPLALDRQAHAIQDELERSGHRDRFELVTRWAVEPLDLLRELRKLKPTVVHFSGHGSTGEAGLVFQGPGGGPLRVTTAAVQQTFGAA